MANCNCNDFPISCAPHAPGGDCCHHPHGCPPHPCPPPDYKGGTSMYIGARYVPIFADPVEWDDEREYEPLTIVTHNGDCYTSKCYVPKGAQLPPYPEGQTKYWVKTSDYNYQFADLKKTVTDLSRLVEQFQKDNEHFTELINGWNETVKDWTAKMEAWQDQMDDFESRLTDLNTALTEEIARAKAAEQANTAAITEETALREAGDTANKNLIEQEQNRAEGEETAIREEFAAADTALNNRITANKTDIDAIKAEQAIQNTNISNNAKNISDNSAEIAKHAKRLTDLESNASDWDTIFPDTTIAQEVQKEELARANADTALNGRCDTIAADVEEVRDLANHKVDQTTFNDADAKNVKYMTAERHYIETYLLDKTGGSFSHNSYILANNSDPHSWGYLMAEDIALKSEVDTAQAAADNANTNIGDWKTDHPNQTISECATSIENEVAAVDAKADANAANIGDWNTEHPGKTIAQEVTRLSGAIPDVSGFVTETTYNAGQAAQDAKITAAQTAANKANTSIGDWDAEHPGQTIAQEVTRLNGAIPDVSGFVTKNTYEQEQAAQDTKINAAQAAANKANTNIGDWDAQHPGKTIAQAVTDAGYLAFLNDLYPQGSVVPGGSFYKFNIYPAYYVGNTSTTTINIPVFVPDIVARFPQCWTLNSTFPTSILIHDAAGNSAATKTVKKAEILDTSDNPRLLILFNSSFTFPSSGIYYFEFLSAIYFGYSWTKNATPFSSPD